MSYSGGKDSTVLLDLVRQEFPSIPAVFCDTGLEYPEIREQVKRTENVTCLYPEKWDRHKMEYVPINFKEVLRDYGYPVVSKKTSATVRKLRTQNLSETYRNYLLYGDSRGNMGTLPKKWHTLLEAPFPISDQCCEIMKKRPFKRYAKLSGRVPIIGTMAAESTQREMTWLLEGCNSFQSRNPSCKPLSFWTEQDILEYLLRKQLPYASVYGDIARGANGKLFTTGVHRTGCIYCMLGAHLEPEPNRFQRLKITHPKLYDYCIHTLALGTVLDYIGVNHN